MLSTCRLSDVSEKEDCSAALDVDAMVCMVKTWRMSSISSLVAQLTVMLDKSMIVFYSRPFLFQTSSLTLSQMHVVVFSESLFHVGSLPYPTDMSFSAFLSVVLCLLAPCWSHKINKNIKERRKKKAKSCLRGPLSEIMTTTYRNQLLSTPDLRPKDPKVSSQTADMVCVRDKHRVQPGDTFCTIAAQYSVSHDDLLDANKERDVDLTAPPPGMILAIPSQQKPKTKIGVHSESP